MRDSEPTNHFVAATAEPETQDIPIVPQLLRPETPQITNII